MRLHRQLLFPTGSLSSTLKSFLTSSEPDPGCTLSRLTVRLTNCAGLSGSPTLTWLFCSESTNTHNASAVDTSTGRYTHSVISNVELDGITATSGFVFYSFLEFPYAEVSAGPLVCLCAKLDQGTATMVADLQTLQG